MSIVEDALQKLGKNGHQAGLDLDLELESPAAPAPEPRSVAHDLYAVNRVTPRRRSWPLVGASALLLLGGAIWWALDRLPTQTSTPSGPINAGVTPVATPVAFPTAMLASAPASATVSVAAVASAPAIGISAATSSAPAGLAAPVVVAKAPVEEALPDVSTPAWLKQGWRLVEQGQTMQAVQVWESGVEKLGTKNRLVVFGLAQPSLPAALTSARRLGTTAPAVVVRETAGTEQVFRVLLLGDSQVSPMAIKKHLQDKEPYLTVAPAPHFTSTQSATTASRAEAPLSAAAAPKLKAAAPAPVAVPAVAPGKSVPEPAEVKFSVDDSATRALDSLVRGDKAEAQRLADLLIANQPGRWEGHFVQGSVMLASGRAREAEAPLDNALALNPNSTRVLLQRAIAAQEVGQPGKAVVWLRQAHTLAPDNVAVLLNLGYSSELSGGTNEAIAAYKRYLQLSSGRNGEDTQRAYVSERLRVLAKP